MGTRKHKPHIAYILTLGLVWLILSADGDVALSAWQPPTGIPAPSFGIEETYRMYDNPANRNPDLTYHQNAEGGYYTHYVDNTHPDATDTDNPYGTASVPRETIQHVQGRHPTDSDNWIPEGSVIEVHGGPYDYDPDPVPPDGKSVYSDSMLSKPSFLRGVGSPEIHFRMFHLCGQYLVVEGFYFNDTSVYVPDAWNIPNEGADYISIRNNTFVGDGEVTGYNAIDMFG